MIIPIILIVMACVSYFTYRLGLLHGFEIAYKEKRKK